MDSASDIIISSWPLRPSPFDVVYQAAAAALTAVGPRNVLEERRELVEASINDSNIVDAEAPTPYL